MSGESLTPDWQQVVDFACQHECDWAADPTVDQGNWGIHLNDPPPYNQLLGPVFERGPASGLIQVSGETRCEWGPTQRADMTFSITKTYLGLVAGIAFDLGLMPDPDEAVCQRVPALGFDDEHNRQITWAHLLQFTSEWQGTCFGIPDWVDHHRWAGFQEERKPGTPAKGNLRTLKTPGSFWEYNDIRMNQFALALLHLFGRALPEIFRQYIMTPLGASDTWQWHGYQNSWVTVNGVSVQSVPGGGHWGGGMQISARDQALIGQMMLDGGKSGGRQLISREWINRMLTPCDIAPFYGYFTWLNRGTKPIANASANSYFGFGIGGQIVWHEPERNIIGVFRWTDAQCLNELIGMVNRVLARA